MRQKAAQLASDIANNCGSELHVLHVGNTRKTSISLRVWGRWSKPGTIAQAYLRMGDPDDEILRFCEEQGDVGLLVMGSRGLGPVSAGTWGASRRASLGTRTARSWWRAASNAGR